MRFILPLLFSFCLLLATQPGYAQYTSPGDDLTLSLDDLVDLSDGVVTFSDGEYFVNDDINISVSDHLEILESAVVRVEAGKRINIFGAFTSDPASGEVLFTSFDTSSSDNNFNGFRFEDSEASLFRNTIVEYGGGIQIIGSPLEFDQCEIRFNGFTNVSGAINYSNASPVITNCTFTENGRSAIASGANVSGSPQILNNTFIRNVTENSNRPQLNLGPGTADTLRIEGNYIEGFHDQAGGIGLANLLGSGSIVASVRNNVIVGNRFGITQIGNNVSSVIEGNIIEDNDIQGNPNLGGSGLNFNAPASSNTAVVRNNIISGNLWGVTIQDSAAPDFGTEDDHGGNVFFDNENTGQIYALFNNTSGPINAVGNYWGTNDPETAEEYIFHEPDDGDLGPVTYEPINTLHPHIESFVFKAEDNPGLEADVAGTVDSLEYTVNVVLPEGSSTVGLIPDIEVALGVTLDPESGEEQDFTAPVTYTVSTPHGDEEGWTVIVEVEDVSAFAMLQLIHNAADPVLSAVDVYIDGVLSIEEFTFRTATPFIEVPAEVTVLVELTLGGDTGVVYAVELNLEEGETYTAIAQGVSNPDLFAENPSGLDTEFFIDLLEGTQIAADGDEFEFLVYHGVTDAPAVDIRVRDAGDVASGMTYTENTDYFEVPEDVYIIDIFAEGGTEPLYTFIADATGLAGESAIILASGFVTPDQNQSGPAFELLAVLGSGDSALLENSTSVDPGDDHLPNEFALQQNYPNPFNPTTNITFSLPENSDVTLEIFNIQGQRVAVLVNGNRSAGSHSVSFDGSQLASGIYLYRLTAGSFTEVKKMMLVK